MKMFLEILLIIIVIVILFYLFFGFTRSVLSPTTPQSQFNSVCIKEDCFSVELAKTPAERDRGLMYRTELDKNKGMLFIFDKEGIYPFWMKNTLIPLDIIWADSSGKIVFIAQNVQPCKSLICPQILPTAMAKYVLEVNAGIIKETGLKAGDFLELKIKN